MLVSMHPFIPCSTTAVAKRVDAYCGNRACVRAWRVPPPKCCYLPILVSRDSVQQSCSSTVPYVTLIGQVFIVILSNGLPVVNTATCCGPDHVIAAMTVHRTSISSFDRMDTAGNLVTVLASPCLPEYVYFPRAVDSERNPSLLAYLA